MSLKSSSQRSWQPNVKRLTFSIVTGSNSVELSYSDDGEMYNGHGAGLYNLGDSSTVLFKGLAIFKDNVGSFVSAGSIYS